MYNSVESKYNESSQADTIGSMPVVAKSGVDTAGYQLSDAVLTLRDRVELLKKQLIPVLLPAPGQPKTEPNKNYKEGARCIVATQILAVADSINKLSDELSFLSDRLDV